MSYKTTLFAVPREAFQDTEALAAEIVAALTSDFSMQDDLYVAATDIGVAWAFHFRSPTLDRQYRQAMAQLLMKRQGFATITYIFHNDQIGLYWFEHTGPSADCAIGSSGPYMCGWGDEVSVEYPQRGYSNDALKALHAKDEAELTAEEFAAIAEYKNAVTIGFEMFYGTRPNYLASVHADEGWRVWTPSDRPTPERVPLDSGWWAVLEPDLPDDLLALDE